MTTFQRSQAIIEFDKANTESVTKPKPQAIRTQAITESKVPTWKDLNLEPTTHTNAAKDLASLVRILKHDDKAQELLRVFSLHFYGQTGQTTRQPTRWARYSPMIYTLISWFIVFLTIASVLYAGINLEEEEPLEPVIVTPEPIFLSWDYIFAFIQPYTQTII